MAQNQRAPEARGSMVAGWINEDNDTESLPLASSKKRTENDSTQRLLSQA